MPIEKIYAHLSCSDLEGSIEWFGILFGRAPDARPMDGLAEWHHGEHTGLQLYEDEANAGHATLTLFVSGIEDEHARLTDGDLDPGPLERGDKFMLVRLRDPDGNLVVLAQAGA